MNSENILCATYLHDKCDYSFGVLSSHIPPQPANLSNLDFLNKCNSLVGVKNYMTLFIDNIRLYNRKTIRYTNMENEEFYECNPDVFANKNRKEKLFEGVSDQNLLHLCSQLKYMKFVIFTGLEDTQIDEEIFENIPDNVIGIYASNANAFGGKVIPIPFGTSPKLDRQSLLSLINVSEKDEILPKNKLYINHSIGSNPIRNKINQKFVEESWVTFGTRKAHNYDDYLEYFSSIKEHKFMICPDGNAIDCDCYRNWEVLYMKRVPIILRTKYMVNMFKNFPVLFVDDFLNITEQLLDDNELLYQQALNLDMSKLDMVELYNNIINEVETKL